MVGVVGVGEPCHVAVGAVSRLPGALEHHVGGPFTQVEPRARGVEGAAGLLVENHQRLEAVEREAAQGVASACHHAVGHAVAQQPCGQADGVGRRRAGGAERRGESVDGAAAGNGQRAVGAVVVGRHAEASAPLVACELLEEALREVHAAHRGRRDEGRAGAHPSGVAQCLFGGHHPQQRRARLELPDAEACGQLLVREGHLAHGQTVARGEAHRPWGDAAPARAQRGEVFGDVQTRRRNDTDARDCDAHGPTVCC